MPGIRCSLIKQEAKGCNFWSLLSLPSPLKAPSQFTLIISPVKILQYILLVLLCSPFSYGKWICFKLLRDANKSFNGKCQWDYIKIWRALKQCKEMELAFMITNRYSTESKKIRYVAFYVGYKPRNANSPQPRMSSFCLA